MDSKEGILERIRAGRPTWTEVQAKSEAQHRELQGLARQELDPAYAAASAVPYGLAGPVYPLPYDYEAQAADRKYGFAPPASSFHRGYSPYADGLAQAMERIKQTHQVNEKLHLARIKAAEAANAAYKRRADKANQSDIETRRIYQQEERLSDLHSKRRPLADTDMFAYGYGSAGYANPGAISPYGYGALEKMGHFSPHMSSSSRAISQAYSK